jgi:hypothetical protein
MSLRLSNNELTLSGFEILNIFSSAGVNHASSEILTAFLDEVIPALEESTFTPLLFFTPPALTRYEMTLFFLKKKYKTRIEGVSRLHRRFKRLPMPSRLLLAV